MTICTGTPVRNVRSSNTTKLVEFDHTSTAVVQRERAVSSRFVVVITPSPRTPFARAPRRLSRVVPATALALVAGVLGAPAATAAPEPGAVGIGDPYFPLDGNGGLDVAHYDVHDRYRFGSGRLSGHTTLTVEATQDLSSFHLDFLLPVRGVRVDGVAADFSRPRQHEVRIEPASPLADGDEFTVRVSYSGLPQRRSYDGESNWLADRHEVVAMNQPHMAPWWFPANDHPADKALMDISITVPSGKKVVANGLPVDRERHGSRTTHHWRADEPMATYLAMFAAGPFHVERRQVATRQGGPVPVRLLVSTRLSDDHYAASLKMLRRTPRLLRELQADLGDYPFSTAGGLVTSLPVGFALENQTIPTYFWVGRGNYDWLVVHEQAHQWFGDSVAVQRWARHLAQRGRGDLLRDPAPRAQPQPRPADVAAAPVGEVRAAGHVLEPRHRRPRRAPDLRQRDLLPRRDDLPGAAPPDRRGRLLAAAAPVREDARGRQRHHRGLPGDGRGRQRPGPRRVLRRLDPQHGPARPHSGERARRGAARGLSAAAPTGR